MLIENTNKQCTFRLDVLHFLSEICFVFTLYRKNYLLLVAAMFYELVRNTPLELLYIIDYKFIHHILLLNISYLSESLKRCLEML